MAAGRQAIRAALALALVGQAALAAGPVKLASPGLEYKNLSQETGNYLIEHYAQALDLLGVRVVTPREITTLLGMERQRQIIGCGNQTAEGSCLFELANALGVDGTITGSLGKYGATFQLNLVVVSARDNRLLSSFSGLASSEPELIELMGRAARQTAPEIGRGLGKPVEVWPHQVVSTSPLSLLGGVFNAEYERALSDRLTVFGGPEVVFGVDYPGDDPLLIGAAFSGLSIRLGVRYYFTGRAPSGLYLGGLAGLLNLSITGGALPLGIVGIPFGVEGGYKLLLWKILALDFGLQVGTWAGTFYLASGESGSLLLPPAIGLSNLKIAIGFAF